MALNDARIAWVVATVALAFACIGGMVTVSVRAGSLEDRVSQVERNQASVSGKLDSISDAVARIEGKMEREGTR